MYLLRCRVGILKLGVFKVYYGYLVVQVLILGRMEFFKMFFVCGLYYYCYFGMRCKSLTKVFID